jgi:hypothetical protein
MTSDAIEVSLYSRMKVGFSFNARGMESTEDFLLEFRGDDSSSWTTAGTWRSGGDFLNGSRYNVAQEFDLTDSHIQLRFRCDATSNKDKIYIDDVVISGST